MPFFIAVALLLALSSAYLLHQFWSHALVRQDEASSTSDPASEREETLKAA